MKALRLSSLLACLLFLTRLGSAEEPALTEKIQDVSSDKKFAMRIRYDAETARWGLSWVYYLRGDQFVPVSEDAQSGPDVEGNARGTWAAPLEIGGEGDVRREWLKPIRWVKAGVLLLEQSVIFGGADAG